MKNLNFKNLPLLMLLLCSSLSFSQSWSLNGNAAGVNNYLGTSNATTLNFKTNATTRMSILHTTGNVGIGTTAPSVQFHTTGAVRFQGLLSNVGLTNLVVADASGNLAVRDISTLNTWNTTGNTTGGFIGTNNNLALPFRTNAVERLRITETGLVGIGITTPTAQLHTTSTVRLAGLALSASAPRYVVSDGSGNLAYKDLASTNDFWKPAGNAAIAGNFIGTSNNIPLPFKTNNIERMRITESGNVGIGTAAPSAQLHTTGSVRLQGVNDIGFINSAINEKIVITDANGNLSYVTAQNMYGLWSTTGNEVVTPVPNIFIGTKNAIPLEFKTNNSLRMVIGITGNVGIGSFLVPSEPTVNLHVRNGSGIPNVATVRFENLALAPSGTVLIQDPQGNVFNSGIDVTTLVNLVQNKSEETARIAVLEKELLELKSLLKKANPTSITPTETKATLYQNYPNPTGGFTNIKVVVQGNNATVQCNIYDINNTLVQSHAIKGNGEQLLAVDTQSLSSAVYFYTLEIDGKVIDSKKLFIQK